MKRQKFFYAALAITASFVMGVACSTPTSSASTATTDESSGTSSSGGSSSGDTSGKTWSYTVTFDSQGSDTAASPASKTVSSPATTIDELPSEPVKSGYAFVGWYSKSGTKEIAFSATTPVTNNLTVYAKWQTSHFILFDANGGTGIMQPFAISEGGSANLPANAFLRESVTFVGWSLNKNGVVLYADKAKASIGTASVTVYACWNPADAAPASDFTYSITISQASMSKYNGTATDIVIPAYIDGYPVAFHSAFADNTAIVSVVIPETATKIDVCAFEKCTSLKTIHIPATITTIGVDAFYNCTGLTAIYIDATKPPTLVSDEIPENAELKIYVPESAVDTYKTANFWKEHADQISAL